MKHTKRLLALVLALAVTASSGMMQVFAAEGQPQAGVTDSGTSDSITKDDTVRDSGILAQTYAADNFPTDIAKKLYGYKSLNTNQKTLYKGLYNVCLNPTAEKVNLKIDQTNAPISHEEISQVCSYFKLDNPEFFWVESFMQTPISPIPVGLNAKFYYYGSDLTAKKAELEASVNDLLAGTDGLSNTEQARLVHDKLINKLCSYEHYGTNRSSAYDALVIGTPQTAGHSISAGYQILLQRLLIPCIIVKGKTSNDVWVRAKLDEKWYNISVNKDILFSDTPVYTYFGRSDKEFAALGFTPEINNGGAYTNYASLPCGNRELGTNT